MSFDRQSIALQLCALLATFALPAHAQLYKLSFWPSRAAAKNPQVVKIQDHPYGTVAVARVRKIPPISQPTSLIPDKFV